MSRYRLSSEFVPRTNLPRRERKDWFVRRIRSFFSISWIFLRRGFTIFFRRKDHFGTFFETFRKNRTRLSHLVALNVFVENTKIARGPRYCFLSAKRVHWNRTRDEFSAEKRKSRVRAPSLETVNWEAARRATFERNVGRRAPRGLIPRFPGRLAASRLARCANARERKRESAFAAEFAPEERTSNERSW